MQISCKETLPRQLQGWLCNEYSTAARSIEPRQVIFWYLLAQVFITRESHQRMQHLPWLNAVLAVLHQTQTCKQVSPLPASLMSHEPADTVNKPYEAKWSLYLPLGHHSKRPHSCHLSRNKIIMPITAQVPSFSQAQEISLGGQLGTTMFELHTDTHGWHSSPHQSIL